MADITQLSGTYAASWLPWIMIPMIFYILPFPTFAILFLWIEQEGGGESTLGQEIMGQDIEA
ncbi:MAG: photosystem I reaction center subunit VIII [Phormidesmis sp.]